MVRALATVATANNTDTTVLRKPILKPVFDFSEWVGWATEVFLWFEF